jgi:Ser/Thr protein kinase RdoA (MazF antagonist)
MLYESNREGRTVVLRVNPEDRNVQATQALSKWLDYLYAGGAPVAEPMRTQQGQLVGTIDRGRKVATAMTYRKAKGTVAEILPESKLSRQLFHELGCATGMFHSLARDYRPECKLPLPCWDEYLGDYVAEDHLPEPDPPIIARSRALDSHLKALPTTADAFGIIHNDLHLGNFCVGGAGVTVFDFGDCAYGWYVMDIAMLIFDRVTLASGTDQDKASLANSFLQRFLSGYRSEVALSDFWLQQLARFLKLFELNYYVLMTKNFPQGNWGWCGDLFMPDRRDRIVQDVPFVELDLT